MTLTSLPAPPTTQPYVASRGQLLHRVGRPTLGTLPAPARVEFDEPAGARPHATLSVDPGDCATVDAWHTYLLREGAVPVTDPEFAYGQGVVEYWAIVCWDGWTVYVRTPIPAVTA